MWAFGIGGFRLDEQAQRRKLHRAQVDVHAVEVVAQDGGGDFGLPIRDCRFAIR